MPPSHAEQVGGFRLNFIPRPLFAGTGEHYCLGLARPSGPCLKGQWILLANPPWAADLGSSDPGPEAQN